MTKKEDKRKNEKIRMKQRGREAKGQREMENENGKASQQRSLAENGLQSTVGRIIIEA